MTGKDIRFNFGRQIWLKLAKWVQKIFLKYFTQNGQTDDNSSIGSNVGWAKTNLSLYMHTSPILGSYGFLAHQSRRIQWVFPVICHSPSQPFSSPNIWANWAIVIRLSVLCKDGTCSKYIWSITMYWVLVLLWQSSEADPDFRRKGPWP
jgi:hypothetical protein